MKYVNVSSVLLLATLTLLVAPEVSNAQTVQTPSDITRTVSDGFGSNCQYTVSGSWLIPTQTFVPPYSRDCTSAIYPSLTDPNNPDSDKSCRVKIQITSTSMSYLGNIVATSRINYKTSSGTVSTVNVIYFSTSGSQPGYILTKYQAHSSFIAGYNYPGPQYKIETDSVYTATSHIW